LPLEEHQRTGRISVRAFYVRRARRLLRALFTMLAAFLEVAAMPLGHTARRVFARVGLQIVTGVFYIANFVGAWHPHLLCLAHLWSLAMEE
jgi:peptidoglycan/LPS O-acetylase OafA/YrhL